MPPQITDFKEVRFRIPGSGSQSLRVRQLTPRTQSDFVATQSGNKQDVALLSTNASAGVAPSAFYAGANIIRDFQLGNNLHVQLAKDSPVVVVNVENSQLL